MNNPFQSHMNNNNTNRGSISNNVLTTQIWEMRNYQNLPRMFNNGTNMNNVQVVTNQVVSNNVPLLDQQQMQRNFQMNHLASQSAQNESNLPNFKRNISNAEQMNNKAVKNINSMIVKKSYNNNSRSKLFDNLFNGKVKSKENEFKINSADFPALPENPNPLLLNLPPIPFKDSEPIEPTNPSKSGSENNLFDKVIRPPVGNLKIGQNPQDIQSNSEEFYGFSSASTSASKPKIQISSDGKVTNIPGSMLRDQFGMIGEMMIMKLASEEPHLVELNYGHNLNNFGLNLCSPKNIYPSFAGPFADFPLGPHQEEYSVPSEYRFSNKLMTLPEINLSSLKFKEDLLFYLFYTYHNEEIQLIVSTELVDRGWRYHKSLREWIIPIQGDQKVSKDKTSEEGSFFAFDYLSWRMVKKEMNVNYCDLEGYDGWKPHKKSQQKTK